MIYYAELSILIIDDLSCCACSDDSLKLCNVHVMNMKCGTFVQTLLLSSPPNLLRVVEGHNNYKGSSQSLLGETHRYRFHSQSTAELFLALA